MQPKCEQNIINLVQLVLCEEMEFYIEMSKGVRMPGVARRRRNRKPKFQSERSTKIRSLSEPFFLTSSTEVKDANA
ncbi:hypothetical protein TNCT_478021 [Trichonephila clavata]|uniref:Uncharacterized protein n=1 Tax=Trichonephila clavata TaxID=2740835 RepID=A0A8X6JBC1_TRICU|nr:hypothetical protein TNCT_478021 [Trichonephila clavata]